MITCKICKIEFSGHKNKKLCSAICLRQSRLINEKNYNQKYPGRKYGLRKAWRANNKEKRNEQAKKYLAKSYLVRKNYALKKSFNISIDDFNKMLEQQNGVCAICKGKETATHSVTKIVKSLSVDHCHKTNKIRGLLCTPCNTGIGLMKDSAELLQAAIDYLRPSI